ncbi:RsmB/NOP family class I SAM-dependent RNA methyltransferase [Pedobacter sp. SYP-B3415]|uniref:RsmB/NOP family class I SAM-dependent RNA methyltransferase n=1 Tax=Pedobacter sp. SYP-B3415 TaxID=2496641 RepID=UPI00101CAC94|nr:RsmB/NOP family class I SAM-dependent RNA methyltransferase [Pedobacter sp. SYP-B3415]
MKAVHQLRTFEQVLSAYDGSLPLHRFLPGFFKQNRKMGSTDRRWASRYIYSYFRSGDMFSALPADRKLAYADFLCHEDLSPVTAYLEPQLAGMETWSVENKLNFLQGIGLPADDKQILPFSGLLSQGIDEVTFNRSMFIQPDLYIRIRDEHVLRLLEAAGQPFVQLSDRCIALPNGAKLENLLPENSYYVQDLSSQHTATFFEPARYSKWWDTCAASGGKSLLLHSIEPTVELVVSDIRENILDNLEERFAQAGIRKYQRKQLDLLQNNDQILKHYAFDGIILDAPCSGSGTWGRTPELARFFDQRRIGQFAALQKSIARNVVNYLKPGKPLIYITCSAFKAENEDVVQFMLENLPLELERMELISGYTQKADTMFAARLIGK